uniref:Solute carrier family 13 member 2 n=1 Tax=Xiphophorus couchianus TaxID=32473 RepID=A0A3B5LFD3_9TELE
MALYWCTECMPLAVTALLPVVLFPMMGIMKAGDVSIEYLKDSNMLFVGGLLVAIAVEHWNLHKRIALRVLLLVGVRPALLMMGFMIVSAFLSMWISNTATTAMMLPISQAVLHQLFASSDSRVHEGEHEERNRGKCVLLWFKLFSCFCSSNHYFFTQRLFPGNGDVINFASWFGFAFPNMVLMLAISWLWLQFMFLGFNLKKSFGCGMKSDRDKEAYAVMKEEYKKLGGMKFAEGAVLTIFILLVLLWFTREPGFIPGLSPCSGGRRFDSRPGDICRMSSPSLITLFPVKLLSNKGH